MKTIVLLALLAFSCMHACTGMKLTSDDGTVVHGRTLEFGQPLNMSIAVIPRGFSFRGTTPNGAGLRYTSKYAALGTIGFNNLALMDGLNEKGLAVGTFYFPTFAGYSAITRDNQSRALSPVEFSNWILTQFATVMEVKEALQDVVIAPTVSPEWGSTPPPFHYIVYDKSGNCLVIEPLGGNLVTYDNPLGTFTNSPTFDWHMTNLRNYIHLSPYNPPPVSINGLTFQQLGQGAGMLGLPGDFSPPARFIRAAIFSSTATPPKDTTAAISELFHLLNQFDIPMGTTREKINEITYSDHTQITCVRDPENLRYYFKTYRDQCIKMVDLSQFDLNARLIKTLPLTMTGQFIEVSSQLK